MSAPPMLIDFHPVFERLSQLGRDAKTVSDIEAGGSSSERLAKLSKDGLFSDYSDPSAIEDALLDGRWGDESTLLGLSRALGDAAGLAQSANKPMKVSLAAGAVSSGVHAVVQETGAEVALVILTGPIDWTSEAFSGPKAFDGDFAERLKAHGESVQRYTGAI